MNSPETRTERKHRPWGAIVVTTLITIGVAIASAWFTINRSERQAILAEAERVRSVKNNLVSIIEEHVINQKTMDYIRLMRLIELKSRDEKLITRITARDLIEQSEYNILNSRYLDFKQKENYMAIFDQFYKEIIPPEYSPFKDIPHAELLNELARNIQEGSTESSLNLLNQVVERFSTDLAALEKKTIPRKSLTETLLQTPILYAIMIVYILFILLFFPRYMRIIRRITGRSHE